MGSRNLQVSTAFTAVDRVSGVVNRVGKKVSMFSNRAQKDMKRATRASAGFGLSFKKFLGIGLLTTAFFAVGMQIKDTIRVGAEFEKTMDSSAAKFREFDKKLGIETSVKKNSESYKKLENVAREVGANTEFSAVAASKGLDYLAMAGFKTQEAITALPQVVDLATSANIDLARATDIASDTLGAFNLKIDELGRVNDVMARTVTTANTDMEMLFQSFTEAGPVAIAFGASIETVSAMTGKLADAGIKGSRAGTTLKNIFTRLADPVGKARTALSGLGVSVTDSNGNFKDITVIIDELNSSMKGLSDKQKMASIHRIFGKIPLAGVNVLLKEGGQNLRDYRNELINSSGAAKEMAEQMRNNLFTAWKGFQSKTDDLKITTFKIFNTVLGSVVNKISSIVSSIGNWMRANEDMLKGRVTVFFQNLGYVFSVIGYNISRVVNLVSMMINSFSRAGQSAGIIQTLKSVFSSWRNVVATVYPMLQELWATLEDVGVIQILATLFNIIGRALQFVLFLLKPLIKGFVFFAKIVLKALTPVWWTIKTILGAISKVGNWLGGNDEKEIKMKKDGMVSPNSAVIKSMHEKKSSLDINIQNDSGHKMSARQKGRADNINISLGQQMAMNPV